MELLVADVGVYRHIFLVLFCHPIFIYLFFLSVKIEQILLTKRG